MGGSSGSGPSRPGDLAARIRDAEKASVSKEFEASLSQVMSDLLARFNDRDADAIRTKVDQALDCVKDTIEGELRTLFGGSVAKHTYVDGLSDVDALLILNDSSLGKMKPHVVLKRVTDALQKGLQGKATVDQGRVAVTLKYPDGTELQLVPAVKTKEGLRVPAWRSNNWSNIDPAAFSAALTRHNERHGSALVPVIKLAKAINSGLPEPQRLSGYHIESLAIQAFRGYDGPRTPLHMLPHFFKRASQLVKSPLSDRTGQSFHVDEYLGRASSLERQKVSHILDRIAKRMENATGSSDVSAWKSLF